MPIATTLCPTSSLLESARARKGKFFTFIFIIATSCVGFITSIILKYDAGIMGAGAFVVSGTGLLIGKTYSKNVPIESEVSSVIPEIQKTEQLGD